MGLASRGLGAASAQGKGEVAGADFWGPERSRKETAKCGSATFRLWVYCSVASGGTGSRPPCATRLHRWALHSRFVRCP